MQSYAPSRELGINYGGIKAVKGTVFVCAQFVSPHGPLISRRWGLVGNMSGNMYGICTLRCSNCPGSMERGEGVPTV